MAEEALAKALGTDVHSATAGPGSPEVAKKPTTGITDSGKGVPSASGATTEVAKKLDNLHSSEVETTGITPGQTGIAKTNRGCALLPCLCTRLAVQGSEEQVHYCTHLRVLKDTYSL